MSARSRVSRAAAALVVLLCASAALASVQRSGDVPARGGGEGPGRGRRGEETPPAPAPEEEPAEGLAATYFAIADYNGDGRIVFREAQPSLGIDREEFAAYDVDRDGTINAAEFERRYGKILEQGGAFPPPVAKPKARKPGRKSAAEAIEAYDADGDRTLDEREVGKALAEYAVADLAAALAIEKLDKDGTKKLELAEIDALLAVLDPDLGRREAPKAGSVVELFGKPIAREIRPGSTPLPPLITGPVPAFRRLDLDGDGAISTQDLVDLQRPIQLPVRVNALMATLDVDQDGAISEAEFWGSMTSPKRAGR